ncbi:MAG: glycosyltransferase [Candidatus Magasanikbacteria bacterium]|nr:glycosyltransferase [Candidatus Magasanikbacteria bacterium]
MKTLSLIIPIYNGAPYIVETVRELVDFSIMHSWLTEVIFVNDGSLDKTEMILKAYREKKYPFELKIFGYTKNRGKGFALRSARSYVGSVDVVAFTDVELPYGLVGLGDAMKLIETYDMVAGTRVKIKESTRQYSIYRGVATKLFRLFLPREIIDIKDTQCGFKVFNKKIFNILLESIHTFRWVFDIELFVIARRKKMQIATVPVQIKESCLRRFGGVSFLKHGVYIIADILKIHKNIVLRKYD